MPENKNTYDQIRGHKECPKCGGSNDPTSSHCRFCQTSLPRLDLDTLPEELLINNCTIWLARLESLSEGGTYKAAKALDANRKMGIFGKLLTFGSESEPGLSDIVANAERYITVLEGRSRNSPEAGNFIHHYRQRQERAVVTLSTTARKEIRNRRLQIIIPLGLLVAMYIIGYFVLSAFDKTERLESERLERIIEKADQAIAVKDYNGARYFISQIKWSIGDVAKEKVWDEKRDGMLSAVEKMSDNSKQ